MRKATATNQSTASNESSDKRTVAPPTRKSRLEAASATKPIETPKWPPQVVESLTQAAQTGTWLIAVFHIEDNRMQLERTAHNFPLADLNLACRLFVESLQELKSSRHIPCAASSSGGFQPPLSCVEADGPSESFNPQPKAQANRRPADFLNAESAGEFAGLRVEERGKEMLEH